MAGATGASLEELVRNNSRATATDRSEALRLAKIYADGRKSAAGETGIPEADLPLNCPFTPDDVLSGSFLPD
jgi:hypothetical protein